MFKLFAKILKFSGKYKSKIWGAFFFAIIKSISIQMPIYLAYLMYTDFYNGIMTTSRCGIYAIAIVSILIIHFASNYTSDVLQSATGYKLFADKRMELGTHLRKLPMGYFTSGNIGKISSVLSSDMNFIEENVMQTLADMLNYLFSAIIICVFIFIIDWHIGLLVIAISILAVILGTFANNSALKHSKMQQQQVEMLTQSVITHIEGISTIKSYNLLGNKSKDLSDNFIKTKNTSLNFEFARIPWILALEILYAIGMAAVLGLSVYLHLSNPQNFSLPYLVGVVFFVFMMFTPIKSLYINAVRLTVMDACLNRINDILNEKQLDDIGEQHISKSNSSVPEIEYNNVTFAYDNKNTLKNVSFTAEKNKMTALIGPSGGGKSTLANLLARFWDIKNGSIKIRGTDIRDIPLAELMNHISMVFQRVYLFQDTIFNNIAMGKPDATEKEVIMAAKKARCYKFIMQLPDGFDTIIGEGGASLSGGEKQRISIARCILKDAPIVILDEATASVDADNEKYIQDAINELVKGKTVLVIAHRLYTIRSADKIVVVSDGEIAEQGTHDELMNNNGIYKNFVSIREKQLHN